MGKNDVRDMLAQGINILDLPTDRVVATLEGPAKLRVVSDNDVHPDASFWLQPWARGKGWVMKVSKEGFNYADPKSLKNLLLVLQHSPEFGGLFRFNALTTQVEISRNTEWGLKQGPLSDADCIWTASALEDSPYPKASAKQLKEILPAIASAAQYDPLTEYLDACPEWDGHDRFVNFWEWAFLAETRQSRFHCDDAAMYLRLTAEWFWIAMVARGYNPGCRVQTMPILEGHKGLGKSSGLEAIMPNDKWFANTPLEWGTENDIRKIRGIWLYEQQEMPLPRDRERMKAFLRQSYDRMTEKWRVFAESFVRRTVIVATTNREGGYLPDDGSRDPSDRDVWPIPGTFDVSQRIDTRLIAEMRDQLFAQAIAYYREGRKWWPDAEEQRTLFTPEQIGRHTPNATNDSIAEFLRSSSWSNAPYLKLHDFIRACYGIDVTHPSWTKLERSVSDALRKEGFTPRRERLGTDANKTSIWRKIET